MASELNKNKSHLSLDTIMTNALLNEEIYQVNKSEPKKVFCLKGEKMSNPHNQLSLLNKFSKTNRTSRPSYLSTTSQQMYSKIQKSK